MLHPSHNRRGPLEPILRAAAGRSLGVLVLLVLAAACRAGAPTVAASDTERLRADADFSGERAWEKLTEIVDFGPRVVGSAGIDALRGYLRAELEEVGAEVRTVEAELFVSLRGESDKTTRFPLEHLIGVLPGASHDIFILAAHYDSHEPREANSEPILGANGSAAGPALLLELARVMSLRERPYTLWFTLIEGDAGTRSLPAHAGSRSLAAVFEEDGTFDRTRVAVFFDQVADRDLHLVRDLRSERTVRELFWKTARDLGYESQFPPGSGFGTSGGSHRSFSRRGMRRVLLLSDSRYGGDSVPGDYWNSVEDTLEHCSSESLQIVGEVTVESLDRLSSRFRKIDRFVQAPLAEPPALPSRPASPSS